MALIKCPECGKQISTKANACINCGCPMEYIVSIGEVKINLPDNSSELYVGLSSTTITDFDGNTLWKGKHGENASFTIDSPTIITIDMGSWANEVSGIVLPNKCYSLRNNIGLHKYANYSLEEADPDMFIPTTNQ